MDLLFIALGCALLYGGAEWLVGGSAGIARQLGVKALVIGLTVVAYGTSAPEGVVSAIAALDGNGAIAVGNVVGSNVVNLGIILGLTAVFAPPRVDGSLIQREVPVMVASAFAVPAVLFDGVVTRFEGALLLLGAIAFTIWVLAKAKGASSSDEPIAVTRSRGKNAALAVAGLCALIAGGKLLVDGAVGIAATFHIDERIVGLTIVAIGTSLPELATSLVAAARGQSSIAIGNVVGSNIFNALLILGAAAVLAPIRIPFADIRTSMVTMMLITIAGAIALRGDRTISRLEGAALAGFYAIFGTFVLAGL